MVKPITSDTLTALLNQSGRPDLKPEYLLLPAGSNFPADHRLWTIPIPESRVVQFAWDRSFNLVERMKSLHDVCAY